MRILPLEIIDSGEEIILSYKFLMSETSDELWYSISKEYRSFVTDLLDGCLVALLIPAMVRGEDIFLEGSVSERLYYNLSGPYQVLLKHLIPSLTTIQIHPKGLSTGGSRAPGVATGFSCGVDSFCVLADHNYSDVPNGFKITHLFYNNLGSHGKGEERLFTERYQKNRLIADKIGLPYIKVNSNLNRFFPFSSFEKTCTIRNASVPLILQNGIGRFMYASTYSYPDIKITPSFDMAFSDPAALPLLSTESVDMLPTGSQYSRVEKTIKVASIEISHDSLDVCTEQNKAGNCSKCKDCLQTQLTLEIAGLIDQYSKAFNLSVYEKERKRFIGKVIYSNDPLLREVRNFAKERKNTFPTISYLYGLPTKMQMLFPRFSKTVYRYYRRIRKTLKA